MIGDFEPPSAAFEEFMRMFPCLRKSWPGQSGAFIHDDFSRFAENIWLEGLVEEEVEEYGEWLDAVCLYGALNGDILLMQEDGRTGWFFHEESRIEEYTADFETVLEPYTEFDTKYHQPLDAYSAFNPYKKRG